MVPLVYSENFIKRRAVEEADIHVRLEGVDVSKWRVLDAGDGAAVMEYLAHVGAAASHLFKPSLRQPTQFVGLGEPKLDLGIAWHRAGKPKELFGLHNSPSDLKLACPLRPITR